jgi:hypothetical protein
VIIPCRQTSRHWQALAESFCELRAFRMDAEENFA